MVKTVNILGANYKVYTKVDPTKDKLLDGLYGYTSSSERVIVVVDLDKLSGWDSHTTEAKQRQNKITLRHEILHAFLNESGLCESALHYSGAWSANEEMVDWFAVQYPKIQKVYKMFDCED